LLVVWVSASAKGQLALLIERRMGMRSAGMGIGCSRLGRLRDAPSAVGDLLDLGHDAMEFLSKSTRPVCRKVSASAR
jgi:hypothetical protein